MIHSILADLIVIIHFLFILFVLFGGILCFFNIKWAWMHIPAAIWGAGIEFSGWICPLTPLENRLRMSGSGTGGYSSGFIEHYLLPIIYPEELTRNIQIFLGLFVLICNLFVYSALFIKHYKNI
ncbi:MAG: DUF2784 domain-containing protein [Desulfobulbaceae bacterium]|nr:DUF2784 domain-containing protein [Desulfobulbaceae bacterium]